MKQFSTSTDDIGNKIWRINYFNSRRGACPGDGEEGIVGGREGRGGGGGGGGGGGVEEGWLRPKRALTA